MVAGLRLPEHSHCVYCGDPIPFGEEFCDETCLARELERQRKERNKEWLFWGSAVAVMALVVIVGILTKI